MLGHRELSIDEYMDILRRRYWILLLTAILGSAGAYLFSKTLPNKYLSQTVVLVQQPKVDRRFVTPVINEQINERLATMTEQILGTPQLQPVVQQYNLFAKELPGGSLAARAGLLRNRIVVTPVHPIADPQWSGIPGFTVSVTLSDPHTAQQVCARITSMFLEDNARWRAQAAQDTTNFLSTQIADAKKALDQQDAKLTTFKLRYLGKLPDEAQNNMNILTSYNSQLEAATEALNRTQQDKVYLESQLAQQEDAWKATRSGNNQLTLEEQLATLQNKLVLLRARYTDDYPDVIKLKGDIAHLQRKIKAANAGDAKVKTNQGKSVALTYAEPPQIQQLRRQIHEYNQMIQERTKQQAILQKKIDEYQARVQMSPLIDQQFTEMTRDYQTALEFYRNLLTKKAQADMGADLEQRQQSEGFQVVDPATFSAKPSSPNRPLFAGGGAFGGLCLGFAIVLWLELRDKLIRTEQDVEFYLQAPTLALVPIVDKHPVSRMKRLSPALTEQGKNAADDPLRT